MSSRCVICVQEELSILSVCNAVFNLVNSLAVSLWGAMGSECGPDKNQLATGLCLQGHGVGETEAMFTWESCMCAHIATKRCELSMCVYRAVLYDCLYF